MDGVETDAVSNVEETAKRILVACPASLVGNWGNESKKWIGNVRAQCVTADGGAENVARGFRNGSRFKKWKRNRCNHLSIGFRF